MMKGEKKGKRRRGNKKEKKKGEKNRKEKRKKTNRAVKQLRTLLAIPEAADVKFERYSDSAAGWMTLDPQNSAVYKQLYRAAKAKLKLRIKASLAPAEGMIARPPL